MILTGRNGNVLHVLLHALISMTRKIMLLAIRLCQLELFVLPENEESVVSCESLGTSNLPLVECNEWSGSSESLSSCTNCAYDEPNTKWCNVSILV